MKQAIRLRWLAGLLIVSALVICAVYWWRLTVSHDRLRGETLEEIAARGSQLAELQAHHTEALIIGLELSLRQFRNAYQAGHTEDAYQIARTTMQAYPAGAVTHFSTVDVNGYIDTSMVKMSDPVYVGDRDFFAFHRDSLQDRVFLNKPVNSRSAGRWVILITRPIFKGQRFAGVAVLSLAPEYLAKMMEQKKMAEGDIGALLYSDGTFMARSRDLMNVLGKTIGEDRPPVAKGATDEGVFRDAGRADGINRTYAWHRFHEYPLMAVVGIDEKMALSPVEAIASESRQRVLIAISTFMLLAAGFAFLLLRAARQQQRLQESETKYREVVESSDELITTVDIEGRIQFVNHMSSRFYGLPPEQCLGRKAFDFVHEDDRQKTTAAFSAWASTAATSAIRFENRIQSVSGEVFDMDWNVIYSRSRSGDSNGFSGFGRDITQQRSTERALQQSQERLSLLFMNMTSGFAVHEVIRDGAGKVIDYVILKVNPAYEKLTGLTRDKVLGQRVRDVLPYTEDYWIDTYGEVATTGQPATIENYSAALERWYSVYAYRYAPEQFATIIHDITARKEAEQALRESEEQFRIIASSAQDAIIMFDARGAIIFWNPAAKKMFGYASTEVVGKEAHSLLAPERYRAAFRTGFSQFVSPGQDAAGGKMLELVAIRKDGSEFPIELSLAAVKRRDEWIAISIIRDISERKRHEAELEQIAYYDVLTGLPNRRLLADRLRQAVARADRTGGVLAVCYLDLDDFKPINDRYGHAVGDRFLLGITDRLKGTLRVEDTLARLGGDEFVMLFADLRNAEEVQSVLDRVLAAVSSPLIVDDMSASLSASVGVTLYPDDKMDADTLLRHADQAMYVAKSAGKNCYRIFDQAHDMRLQERHNFQQGLRQALASQQFALHYQPKVNMQTGEMVAAEALIRWQHPELGLLLPAAFLHYLEGSELEVMVGEWVVDAALRQAADWEHAGLRLHISVNVSAHHLLQPDFAERLGMLLARYPGVDPRRLGLEILESAALSDMTQAAKTLALCRDLGVNLLLDDFGTGYSSLTYFRNLPVQFLKIDQSFVRDMLVDPADLGIVVSVMQLANTFGRGVIAEGVETIAHSKKLAELGCRVMQGYGIARPMPPEELINWVRDWQEQRRWLAVSRYFPGEAEENHTN